MFKTIGSEANPVHVKADQVLAVEKVSDGNAEGVGAKCYVILPTGRIEVEASAATVLEQLNDS